jgi:mannosyltransferase OCH1-like enzyme
MKICLYLFWFFILILFWQIILILRSVYDSLIGIDVLSFDNQLNETIPRIIHQMWKTEDLSTYPINNSHLQWKIFYPDYKINLWTDKQIEQLILKNEYLHLYSTYKSYFYSIQRADLARLIILHSEGGIYVDLDVFPISENLENLRLKGASLIIPRSSSDNCLINHFLMSEKHSYLIKYILNEIHPKSYLNQIYILPYLEVFSTGSIFLTNIIRKRIYLIKQNKDRLIILSKNKLNQYINHDAGRSWHLFDGYLLNQIDTYPKLFFSFIFILFCFIKFKIFRKFR